MFDKAIVEVQTAVNVQYGPANPNHIKIIDGSTKILLIAPHACIRDGKPKDDENTGPIAEAVARELECSAIINTHYHKPDKKKYRKGHKPKSNEYPYGFEYDNLNLNVIADAEKIPGYLGAIRHIVEAPSKTTVIWIHGADDVKAKAVAGKGTYDYKPNEINAFLGYGQGNEPITGAKGSRKTADLATVERFRDALISNGMKAVRTNKNATNYRGRSEAGMNQWFLSQGYPLEKVESIQIEIRRKGFRNTLKQCKNTAKIIADALSELIPSQEPASDTATVTEQSAVQVSPDTEAAERRSGVPMTDELPIPQGDIENSQINEEAAVVERMMEDTSTQEGNEAGADSAPSETPDDDPLVAEAFNHLKDIFRKHFHDAMLEAGKYIINKFYQGKPIEALAKNKSKHEPPNLKKLTEKLQRAAKGPDGNVPSLSWFYNAVNLAAHEAICLDKGFQTFTKLGHSHKLQLLHVPKLKGIPADEIKETITEIFEEKEELAEYAYQKGLSVRDFKKYIDEMYKSDSIELPNLPAKNDLRRQDKVELVKLRNQAQQKIETGQEQVREYGKALQTLDNVLAEIGDDSAQGKGRFQDWTKAGNNVNICTGCENDCIYCYAKSMAIRRRQVSSGQWVKSVIRQADVGKPRKLYDGLVGFPSTHDITPSNIDAYLIVLGKLLRAGNEVLIVSKPSLECIKAICDASTFFKDKILFRFTIGAMDDAILRFWEPNAPAYEERRNSLIHAFENGFRTSVSMEPMLDTEEIERIIEELRPYVTEDIWLGTMNHLKAMKQGADKGLLTEIAEIEAGQSPKILVALHDEYKDDPLIKWKSDALKVIKAAGKKNFNGLKNNKNWRNGYFFISVIQKAVRRCKINLARYYAKQMLELGKPGWLWKRLLIISSEDIGLADPTMVGYVREHWDTFENLRKQKNEILSNVKTDSELCKIIDQVVTAEAISYTSRLLPMLSFITLYDIFKYENFTKDVSEYLDCFVEALDRKVEREAVYYATIVDKFMGHGDRVLSLIKERSKKNDNEIFISQWIKEYDRKDDRFRLMLVGSIVLLCRDLPNSHGEYKAGINKHFTEPIVEEKIPDYAYDQHTYIGKKKGRGLKHFFEEAAHVENERFENIYKETGEQAYLEAEKEGLGSAKKVIDKVHEFLIPLPFKYEKAVLTQARTSKHRPYAFIVEFEDGSRKFMKGPFKDNKSAKGHLICNDVKRKLKSKYLHPIQCKIKKYTRSKKSNSSEIFLECEELGKADLKDVRIMRTNVESCLFTVLNYHSNDIVPNPFKYLTEINPQNIEIWTAVMVNYCFRWIFGIRDTASRNLVLQKSSGRIYSVDETGIQPGQHEIIWGGKKPDASTFQLIDDFVKSDHFKEVLQEVDRWKQYLDPLSSEVGPHSAEVKGRIDKLLNDHIKVFDVSRMMEAGGDQSDELPN